MYYAVIMAGGSGTRLWPLSRQGSPKQALKLVGERTLFQHAVDRLAPLFPPERVMVVTCAEYAAILKQQTPEIPPGNFWIEPEGRGTAPAIGLAAIALRHRDPQAVMAVLTADHFITNTGGFHRALSAAGSLAGEGRLVTLGIKPAGPATGYGYIQRGTLLSEAGDFSVYGVKRFVEKPALPAAVQMVASGEFSWNSGMFVWQVGGILAEFARQMPEFSEQLESLSNLLGSDSFPDALARAWPQVKKQSIDYGVMEGANNVVVIPVDIGWSDIGSWASLYDLLPADEDGNVWVGPHQGIDTHNTLAFGSRRLIATIGVQNLVIVDTEDAILVCSKDREQEVKEIVRLLGEGKQSAWL